MAELVIRIPGEPFAQPRAKSVPLMRNGKPVIGAGGRPLLVVYDSREAKNWKATAQSHMAERYAVLAPLIDRPLAGPVWLSVLAVFTCPKTDHRKRDPRPRRWHTKRPDADNVLKAVKDAAKGVLWLDDAQVCSASCVKQIGAQGEAPYVEIRVLALGEIVDQGGDQSSTAPVAAELPGREVQPILFEEEQ